MPKRTPKPPVERKNSTDRAMAALAGEDEFSLGSNKKNKPKPLVELKPKRVEVAVPKNPETPEVETNYYLRRMGRIFKK